MLTRIHINYHTILVCLRLMHMVGNRAKKNSLPPQSPNTPVHYRNTPTPAHPHTPLSQHLLCTIALKTHQPIGARSGSRNWRILLVDCILGCWWELSRVGTETTCPAACAARSTWQCLVWRREGGREGERRRFIRKKRRLIDKTPTR